MSEIFISRAHFPVSTLGPGRRLGIWFQGCSLRCVGCISADTWAVNRGLTSIDTLEDALAPWVTSASGLTITGGEPFEQLPALRQLLHRLRPCFPEDVIVYTGYEPVELRGSLEELDGLIDLLVAGRFVEGVASTSPIAGSGNQKLLALTFAGTRLLEEIERHQETHTRNLDVAIARSGEVWLAGVPRTDDWERFRKILEQGGHQVALSSARSAQTKGREGRE